MVLCFYIMNKRQFNVMLGDDIRDGIREVAAKRGISLASAGRDLLRAALVQASEPGAASAELTAWLSAQSELSTVNKRLDDHRKAIEALIESNTRNERFTAALVVELINRDVLPDIVQKALDAAQPGTRNLAMHLVERASEAMVDAADPGKRAHAVNDSVAEAAEAQATMTEMAETLNR